MRKTSLWDFQPGPIPVSHRKKLETRKFQIEGEDRMYYPSMKKEDAGHCTAELSFCFGLCQNSVFSLCSS